MPDQITYLFTHTHTHMICTHNFQAGRPEAMDPLTMVAAIELMDCKDSFKETLSILLLHQLLERQQEEEEEKENLLLLAAALLADADAEEEEEEEDDDDDE